MRDHLESKVFHPSSRPAGHGATIGTPRLYDLSATLLFGGRRRWYGKLPAAGGVRPGDRVLDIGCGPGYFARLLAEVVGPEGSVVGKPTVELLEHAGFSLVAPPESFVVKGMKEPHLEEGESERAKDWATAVAKQVESQLPAVPAPTALSG